jgi:maltooligosyltrehalose trehalohydrolase
MFGPELQAGGGTRFNLWAPAASAVTLVLEGAGEHPMQPSRDGWHRVDVAQAGAGTRYRFKLPDGLLVPDPASHRNPDDVHGASEVVDPHAYNWQDAAWQGRPWHEAVIYELHVGTFTPEGTFAAAQARLADLAALGITAIELMPLADAPGQRNWGYDGVLHFAPAAQYGTPNELRALVDHAHALGLMVLVDVVYNHFGPDGNYLHAYCPAFFNPAHQTPWGAAVNFDGDLHGPVRAFYVANALYWIEQFHCDGLRLDAVHQIRDDSPQHIVDEIAQAIAAGPGARRQVHLVLENDTNQAHRLQRDAQGKPLSATAQWNDDLHHAAHVLATGETDGYYADYAVQPAQLLGRALAEGYVYQGQVSQHSGVPRGEPSGQLPPVAFISFLQNHDQIGNTPFGERITADAPEALVHAAVAIVLLSPQIPLLFMGEEWATVRPFMFFCDFEPELAEAVRNGRKREFAQFAEFGEAAAQGRIPDATAESSFEACRLDWSEREREPHRTWLERYRQLLRVRRDAIVPRLAGIGSGGAFQRLGPAALRAEWRLGDGALLLLLANFGNEAVPLGDPPPNESLLYCTGPEPPQREIAPGCAAFCLIPSGSETR